MATKIKVVCAAMEISCAEVARNMGMSPQLFSSRMQKQRFSEEEIQQLAAAMGVKYVSYFELPDGTKI